MKAVAWEDVPEEILIQGIQRRFVTGQKVMLGLLKFPKGAVVPTHQHTSEQITHVLSGSLRFVVGEKEVIVSQGEVLYIPSDVPHSAEALEPTQEVDAFSPIRSDWLDGSDAYLRE